MPNRSLLPSLAEEILTHLPDAPRCWLTGGAVRDQILGRPIVDLDFAVDGEARLLARRVASLLGADYYELDAERDTGRVLLPASRGGQCLDFARLRGDCIEADLAGRDYSIDAMAVSPEAPERVIDPTGGLQDLRDRRLKVAGPTAIDDDPLRALRGIRLATELDLRIEPQTLARIRMAGNSLARVSPERIRDEWMRVLQSERPGRPIRLLDHLGLLSAVCPEIEPLRGLAQPPPHAFDGLTHTLAVIDHLGDLLSVLGPRSEEHRPADLTLGEASLRLGRFRAGIEGYLHHELAPGRTRRGPLFMAALFHDVGKPATGEQDAGGRLRFLEHESHGARLTELRSRAMRLSNDETDFLISLVLHHMRPETLQAATVVTRRAAYRFFQDAGDAGVGIVLLSLADLLGKYAASPPQAEWGGRVGVARSLLQAFFEEHSEIVDPQRLVNGDEVMQALSLQPGPTVGRLIETLREAQAEGGVRTRDEALAFLRATLAGMEQAERRIHAPIAGQPGGKAPRARGRSVRDKGTAGQG
jgi:tRNA nucleotidyltransferase/poly(A) polymerase